MSNSAPGTSVMLQIGHRPGASEVWSGCIGQRKPTSVSSSAAASSRLAGGVAREAHEGTATASASTTSERPHANDVLEKPIGEAMVWSIPYDNMLIFRKESAEPVF